MNNKKTCPACAGADTLIFACSGAADTGEISDLAARVLTESGSGRMFCLAGVGGRVTPILKQVESAGKLLVIDGCALDCALQTMERAGFEKTTHLRVTDLGLAKGQSPVNEERVSIVVQRGAELLNGSSALNTSDL